MELFCEKCGTRLTGGRRGNLHVCAYCKLIYCKDCFRYFLCIRDFEKLDKLKQDALKIIYYLFFVLLFAFLFAAVFLSILFADRIVLLYFLIGLTAIFPLTNYFPQYLCKKWLDDV